MTERILVPMARKYMEKSDEERIQSIKDGFFIEYKVSQDIVQELLDLFDQPVRPRMEGLLIFSPTNNGKTTLVEKFIEDYSSNVDGKLIRVETPERATLKEFYAEALDVLGYPTRTTRSTGDLRRKILEGIKRRKVKMIFFDEIHNLLDSRRDHKKDILNGLRSLNNKAEIPIVLIGIESAKEILELDEQVADRYPPLEIPLWQNNRNYLDLLSTFEAHLPLKKASNLHEREISSKIYELSEGKLGRIATIIRKSSIKSIRTGNEQIILDVLNSIQWRWENGK